MSEYEALNLMYLGFTFNAIYTLGFILFTWLGFRMARNIYEDTTATMLGKGVYNNFLPICCILFYSIKHDWWRNIAILYFNLSRDGFCIR